MTTAPLVVDMVNDFVTGNLTNSSAVAVIDPIKKLMTRWMMDGNPVYMANDAHHEKDLELAVLGPHAMLGTHGANVIPELGRTEFFKDPLLISKRYYSAFTETDLAPTIYTDEIDTLVIVGQHTDCCVRHTAYDAWRMGLKLVVVSDATCVYTPEDSGEPPAQTLARQDQAIAYLGAYYNAATTRSKDLLA